MNFLNYVALESLLEKFMPSWDRKGNYRFYLSYLNAILSQFSLANEKKSGKENVSLTYQMSIKTGSIKDSFILKIL